MLFLAYSIILLHAVVPHHHHDCGGGEGFVFEDEISCTCDNQVNGDCCHHHDADGCCPYGGHSHHPFDTCKLQDLLSQLVISTRDDKVLLTHAPAFPATTASHALLVADCSIPHPVVCNVGFVRSGISLPLLSGWAAPTSLRAPPQMVLMA